MNFETIKINFNKKLWSEAMVKVAVKKGVITKEQYKAITGKDFTV
jgi:uncharacterized XkdX family phage protein